MLWIRRRPEFRFMVAVASRWHVVLTAVLGDGILALWQRDQPASGQVGLIALIIALLAASYLVWHDLDNVATASKNELAEIRLRYATLQSPILSPSGNPITSVGPVVEDARAPSLPAILFSVTLFVVCPVAIVYVYPQISLFAYATYAHLFNPPISQLNDREIIEKAHTLSASLNALQAKCDTSPYAMPSSIETRKEAERRFYEEEKQQVARDRDCSLEYRTTYQSDARSLVADLQRRVAPYQLPQADPFANRFEAVSVLDGSLAGADPLTALATYLTDLSDLLVTKDEHD